MDDRPDTRPRSKPRSTVRVLGSLFLFVLVAGFILVQCLRIYAGSTPPRTLDVLRSELSVDVPKFYPQPSMGSWGSQTHGVWVTLRPDGAALAFASQPPEGNCLIGFRAEQTFEAAAGVYRNPCTNSLYARDGRALTGPTPRGLDRYPTRATDTRVIVDLEHLTRGPAH